MVEWFHVPWLGWVAALLGGCGIAILARTIWDQRISPKPPL